MFESTLILAPHLEAFTKALQYKNPRGICSAFERFNHGTALRIAQGLKVVREYVRGDVDAVNDIADGYGLYEILFPEPKER